MPTEEHPRLTQRYLPLGTNLTIFHINVEGFSSSKSDYFARLMLEEKVDVIAVQETHTASAESLRSRGNLTGFTLVGDVYSSVCGIATYIRSDLSNWRILYQDHTNNVHVLAVELDANIIVNVYKPPSTSLSSNPLKIFPHPAIYLCDFNSHNQQWGYDHNDVKGNVIHEWMTLNSLHLIYHPKDKGTFRSARWNKDYTPDLSIVTRAAEDDITVCICVILDGFLKSQHRPVLLQYGRIPLTESVRIQPLIDAAVPVSQAGFWKNRSCTQQVMALTSHIETGFERKLKTGTIFIDLTAAYDTVWRDGLMLNFMRVVSCSKISRLLNNMLSNRYFQTNSFAECETTLEADLDKLDEFFRRWRLQPNPAFLAPHTKQTDCWT
jgi:hypothetical protein